MNNAFKSSPRTSHTISKSSDPRNMPAKGSLRSANVNSPAPLGGLAAKKSGGRGRCASCGGGRKF